MFERFPKRLAVAAVLLVSGGVYINALGNGFVYDDRYLVLENPWIRDFRHIPEIFTSSMWSFFTEVPQNFYRPVMQLVYMLDYHLFGPEPWGFHLTKILFHMGSSVLVLLTASELMGRAWKRESEEGPSGPGAPGTGVHAETHGTWIALIAALLFASHPVHTDAVLNGITEVTFTFFYLLSFLLYMKGRRLERPGPVWASAFFFLISALSKETALTLPVLLLAFDYSGEGLGGGLRRVMNRYSPYLLAAALYSALRIYALGAPVPAAADLGLSPYEYAINILALFAQYIGKLLVPINLNAAYVFHPVTTLLGPGAMTGLLVTALFLGAVYISRARSRVVFISLMLVLVPLVPALYLPALVEHVFSERYLYLPSAGFVILVSMGLAACDWTWRTRPPARPGGPGRRAEPAGLAGRISPSGRQ